MKGTTRFCIIFGVLFLFAFDSIAQLTSASIIDSRPLIVQPAYQQTVRLLMPSDLTSMSTLDFLLGTAGRHSAQDDAARKLIAEFAAAKNPELKQIIAMQICNDYTARMRELCLWVRSSP